tara:strand:+ start:6680 stop:6931 length:252 start_codon:yes stop_codon:yes gene_type:complete
MDQQTEHELSEDAVRAKLLERADSFAARTGYSQSRMSEEALRDSKFLSDVRSGRNFTVKTMQKFLDWLEGAEKAVPSKAGVAA